MFIFAAAIAALAVSTIEGTLVVQLSESDYNVGNSDAFLPGLVVANGAISSSPVQVQITPLTFDQYTRLFPNSDGPCTIPSDIDPAESTDFDQTVIDVEIPAGSNGASFQLSLPSQTVVEAEEMFLVLLNVTSGDGQVGARECATIQIASRAPARRDFVTANKQNQEILETFISNKILFTITKEVETELQIEVTVRVRRTEASSGTDFLIPNGRFVIEPEQTEAQVNLTIFDDTIPEDRESITLDVSAKIIGITFLPVTFTPTITILDDDLIILGFSTETIEVLEGETAMFCVQTLNDTSTGYERFSKFDFPLFTTDGTARAGVDFTALDPSLIYQPIIYEGPNRRGCFSIETMNNPGSQPSRSFTVNLDTSREGELTNLQPSSIQINIVDNDGPPIAPQVQEAEPGPTSSETLTISWSAESSRQNPIDSFIVRVRQVGSDEVLEFDIDSASIREFTLEGYDGLKEYEITICAVNNNGEVCSSPFSVPSSISNTPTPPPIRGLSPGLIAGIVVIVLVAVLCCCLLLLFLCLCLFCKKGRGKAYYLGKGKKRETNSNRHHEESNSHSFTEEDELKCSPPSEKAPL